MEFEDLFDGKKDIYNEENEKDIKLGIEFEPLVDVKEEEKKIRNSKTKIPQADKNNLLKVIAYPTKKNKIKQRPLMEKNIIPKHPSRVIFNGKSGSGKSNLLTFLCSQPHMYGKTNPKKDNSMYFDIVFLFSPTADGQDDLPRYLNLKEKRIFTDFNIDALDNILAIQDEIIKEHGIERSPKLLIIFDDIQSDVKFMNSKSFTRCFIQGRHLNASIFVCGQSWTKLPRVCRLQASNIFFFPSSQSEVEILSNEYTPANTSKKDFQKIIKHATNEQYNFLHINCDAPVRQRFRKNLDKILFIK